ncbi:MAG: PD-(D/E)XK nuclease family protein [Candidatus Methanomethylophilaceae archaeon]
MQSAGDLEKYGYCPVSWWLSREVQIQNQDTARGIDDHQDASEGFRGLAEQERSFLDWHFSLFISLTVLINLFLVFLIFVPSMPLSPKRYMLLGLTFMWMGLAAFYLYRQGKDGGYRLQSFQETAVTVLSLISLLLSFNIIALILLGNAPEWIYGFFSLIWLCVSVLMAVFERQQNRVSQKMRGLLRLGGEVEYVGEDDAPVLRSESAGVAGRPDLIIRQEGGLVPLELKTGRTPRGPLFSHILQIGAYCIIVSEVYGQRVEKGILRYPKQDFDVEFDENLEALVREKLREMEELERSGDVRRNHQRKGKCDHCSRLQACPQAIR